ncbi:hypothetical protein WJX77_004199 [Trebouxia sp. C0004]
MPLHTKSCSTEGNLVPEAVDEQDNAWYPMAVVEDLDESKPIPVKLFGKSLVLWHDAAVQWKCLAETCPHRLAPFSEGRIAEDGMLQCLYHGWKFDTEGHVTLYLEAMSTEANIIPDLLHEGNTAYAIPWFMRELPYGHDVLMESWLDPAHMPFARHGVSKPQQIVSYSTPTTPGNCRVLFAVVTDRKTAPKRTMQLLDLKPAWLKFMDHYERKMMLDGDNCFLHMQDRKLHGQKRWMRETAGPVPWAGLLGPDIWTEAASRHELLDRYNQHTKHRKHCSKALEVFTVAQRGAAGGFAAAALLLFVDYVHSD